MTEIPENMVDMAFEGEIQLDTLKGQTVVYLYVYYLAEQKIPLVKELLTALTC